MPSRGIQVEKIPAQQVAARLEIGAMEKIAVHYDALAKWSEQNGYVIAGPAGMVFYSDQETVPVERRLTEIFFPVNKKQ